MRQAGAEELRGELRSTEALSAAGISERGVARDVASGSLVRVHRGWYLHGALWQELWPESRHLAHVLAVSLSARGSDPLFCLVSAACLWGLPLYRITPRRVHVYSRNVDRHSTPDVLRHEGGVPDHDIAERHGLRCTSLARTVYDLARMLPAEAGLAAADAALASVGGDPRAFDDDRADALKADLDRRTTARAVRGIRRAREVLALSDGRAQLPLESVARLQLVRLGFQRPRLQVPVADPHGGSYWIDIALDDVEAFCEVDGQTKYLDEALRSGRSLEQVLLDEKQREDWIRGVAQRRMARVGDVHVRDLGALRIRLAAFGIRPRRG
ncbi:hypothetical protein [Microbacterium caowuchunii]|uniref:Transcriptional regulator, AbiEi antitoxin, Type IV TA system n=1 Tax=Microbacterium caowuchunii TaxID=2614638 RepID=A0A5N0TQE3_9MICO|nr:hypothetical protein [Microbacterium caowuchunii]KAA9135609.1 hypothetical protein F6B40_02120 [Microbacterium caowuchunii]